MPILGLPNNRGRAPTAIAALKETWACQRSSLSHRQQDHRPGKKGAPDGVPSRRQMVVSPGFVPPK
jgi:hypothetical protein